MNPDFLDMLSALSEEGAEYLLPQRIDILTSIDGVDFEEAWPSRLEADVAGQVVAVISRDHLAQNKRASGRPQDLADLAWLEGAGAE